VKLRQKQDKMMKTKTLMTLAVAGALVAGATAVKANPELELISGSVTKIVVQSSPVGSVTFSGAVGQWSLNVTTGVNDFGGPGNPVIDVNSIDEGSGRPLQSLTIEYTAGGYTHDGTVVGTIGGTTTTAVADYQYLGSSAFSTAQLLTAIGPLGPGAFAGTAYGNTGVTTAPYWLTEKIVISGGNGGALTSFDANSSVPDGGMTMVLLGSAFAGLGAIRSRFGAKRA
jgi:hypothetical protein